MSFENRVLIFLIGLIFFGALRLPMLARQMGEYLQESRQHFHLLPQQRRTKTIFAELLFIAVALLWLSDTFSDAQAGVAYLVGMAGYFAYDFAFGKKDRAN